ncbi:hypothetical protein Tco_0133346 [Tanacetum coccineum]
MLTRGHDLRSQRSGLKVKDSDDSGAGGLNSQISQKNSKDHPKGQILGDPTSAVQTRGKIQKASFFSTTTLSMIGSLMYLTASRPDIMFAVVPVLKDFKVTTKASH